MMEDHNKQISSFPFHDLSVTRSTPIWHRWQQVVPVLACVLVSATWVVHQQDLVMSFPIFQTISDERVAMAESTTTTTSVAAIQIQQPKILVVFSGPATRTEGDVHKNELYIRNLDFFLEHGVDCKVQDTIIVLGHDVAPLYRNELTELDKVCQRDHSHRITLLERDDVCYDMESVRIVVHDNVTDILAYDYFIYVNCGTTGPVMLKNENQSLPWTSAFIDKMVGNVKMVGLSHNCGPVHIQSMVYCLDKVAIKLIKESTCVFDCRPLMAAFPNMTKLNILHRIIREYEKGMSRKILDNGYDIMSLTRPKIFTKENRSNCTERDLWVSSRLKTTYGKIPSLGEVLFFKTSRVLTPETAALINFTGKIWWNW